MWPFGMSDRPPARAAGRPAPTARRGRPRRQGSPARRSAARAAVANGRRPARRGRTRPRGALKALFSTGCRRLSASGRGRRGTSPASARNRPRRPRRATGGHRPSPTKASTSPTRSSLGAASGHTPTDLRAGRSCTGSRATAGLQTGVPRTRGAAGRVTSRAKVNQSSPRPDCSCPRVDAGTRDGVLRRTPAQIECGVAVRRWGSTDRAAPARSSAVRMPMGWFASSTTTEMPPC
jgi:hypothetical protein